MICALLLLLPLAGLSGDPGAKPVRPRLSENQSVSLKMRVWRYRRARDKYHRELKVWLRAQGVRPDTSRTTSGQPRIVPSQGPQNTPSQAPRPDSDVRRNNKSGMAPGPTVPPTRTEGSSYPEPTVRVNTKKGPPRKTVPCAVVPRPVGSGRDQPVGHFTAPAPLPSRECPFFFARGHAEALQKGSHRCQRAPVLPPSRAEWPAPSADQQGVEGREQSRGERRPVTRAQASPPRGLVGLDSSPSAR